ncbi:RNA polymerase sigma-70 factor, ECF subfamily [Nocardiopsis flavescens]|uniref:RNA polymerase sigma-70 factor, ECF subfamily n=1 Tax=Nocardiopsis flavescens TaxID=758803 RepID=A0A1M6PGH8_9ACTN|nr:RNA polymerase sigma factor [Nocardiopsis flavescens]SHK07051.1 RNA polymerase sigma-70 factor, ECF subfamily [Nocardiopsis flavescens]
MKLFRRAHRRAPSYGPDSADPALLTAIAAGEAEALEILHRRHAPWLRARLNYRCSDPDQVDAALQETFLAVWKNAGSFTPRPGDTDAGAWLWTIAIRQLISQLRRRANRWISDIEAEPYETIGDASAEETVLLNIEHGPLGTALHSLSPELRAAIQATVLDGLTVREAARILQIPEGTVKTRVMRAKARLREALTS